MAWSRSSKTTRYKYFLSVLFQQYQPRCYFCKNLLDYKEFFPKTSGKQLDGFVLHHENENRKDNRVENLTWSHRGCHSKHHKKIKGLVQMQDIHKEEKP